MEREEKVQLYAKEIKNLEESNQQLKNKLARLENELFSKTGECEEAIQKLQTTLKENENWRTEKKLLEVKYQNKIKNYQAQLRKSDFFKETYRGSSKMKQRELINKEMKIMKGTNKTLCDFIKVISEKLDFDEEIIKEMLKIAEDVNDPIIVDLIRVLTENDNDTSLTVEENIKNIFY
ncbi:hypothetical protein NUSPORA_00213 [Nucleospora cyclopteri]